MITDLKKMSLYIRHFKFRNNPGEEFYLNIEVFVDDSDLKTTTRGISNHWKGK